VSGLLAAGQASGSALADDALCLNATEFFATREVVDALARLKQREYFTRDDDLVFCTAVGGFLDDMWLRRRYYRAIEGAGLRRIRFDDLRHTARSPMRPCPGLCPEMGTSSASQRNWKT
jgi:hypothetical protein